MANRIIRAIVRSRFEPVETILAISAVLHGLWLLFPYWGFAAAGSDTISGSPRTFEITIGIVLGMLGVLHFTALTWGLQKLRYNVAFMKFMAWFFFVWLAFIAAGPDSIIWISYLTISGISASVYLNISARTKEEREREY